MEDGGDAAPGSGGVDDGVGWGDVVLVIEFSDGGGDLVFGGVSGVVLLDGDDDGGMEEDFDLVGGVEAVVEAPPDAAVSAESGVGGGASCERVEPSHLVAGVELDEDGFRDDGVIGSVWSPETSNHGPDVFGVSAVESGDVVDVGLADESLPCVVTVGDPWGLVAIEAEDFSAGSGSPFLAFVVEEVPALGWLAEFAVWVESGSRVAEADELEFFGPCLEVDAANVNDGLLDGVEFVADDKKALRVKAFEDVDAFLLLPFAYSDNADRVNGVLGVASDGWARGVNY